MLSRGKQLVAGSLISMKRHENDVVSLFLKKSAITGINLFLSKCYCYYSVSLVLLLSDYSGIKITTNERTTFRPYSVSFLENVTCIN